MNETEDKQSGLQLKNRLFWRAFFIAFLVFFGVGLSGQVAKWAVAIGAEWISVSDLGMMVIGVWGMLSAGIAEMLTDRVFRHMAKN